MIEPASASLCARHGFRTAEGTALGLPRIDGLVSALSVGTASGSDQILVILGGCAGGCALEVLRSRTSDGMCEAQAKQGPLTVCHGEEYERVAEVRLVPPARFDDHRRVRRDYGPARLCRSDPERLATTAGRCVDRVSWVAGLDSCLFARTSSTRRNTTSSSSESGVLALVVTSACLMGREMLGE